MLNNSFSHNYYNYNSNDNMNYIPPYSENLNANYLANKENFKKKDSETNDCFEIFGLKLHFDDILIICLIFFLYQENVHDEMLFIALLLLLLS